MQSRVSLCLSTCSLNAFLDAIFKSQYKWAAKFNILSKEIIQLYRVRLYLRNRFALAVICFLICHWLKVKAQLIYPLTTERQTVIN